MAKQLFGNDTEMDITVWITVDLYEARRPNPARYPSCRVLINYIVFK